MYGGPMYPGAYVPPPRGGVPGGPGAPIPYMAPGGGDRRQGGRGKGAPPPAAS